MARMWQNLFAIIVFAFYIGGCGREFVDRRSPIVIADEYMRRENPQLLIEHPIRSLDQNAHGWLIYYFRDPRKPEPTVFGSGFIVFVEKKTGKPMFGGFQQ
ncbi:hypothetical protein KXR53_25050 [Inquilinus limosus]|uniref:hypothetical protein n=1 Tax=Inquilinus limosus TaxID=171674 RepID=UPI003F16D3E1